MKIDRVRDNPAAKYLIIALLPMLVLLWTPVSNYAVLHFGEKVLLRTEPVDPRDILRGDYVNLEYEISDIPKEMFPEGFDENQYGYGYGRDSRKALYVSLERDGAGIARVSGVSETRPPGGLYLKAFLAYRWSGPRVDYNLGVYYVPEGTGRALEEAIRENDVLADVRVMRGRGVIKNLEVVR